MFKIKEENFESQSFEDKLSQNEEVEDIVIGEDRIREKKITLTKRT